ncbi:hypothetical protein Clacol_009884 [Clathrus columnatus]|uniref:Flavin reductase like domain-containing protein n=1 Tax=Clathrus columnatus TaxID=1419009 RepID=A0AAV5ATE0_9AGAM|nr:hypothetical protein Clacol_009884 [Clathrus columnatus]
MHAFCHVNLGKRIRTRYHLQNCRHYPRRTRLLNTSVTGIDTKLDTLRNQCLAILRTIAQPVSIITTLDWEREQSLKTELTKGLSVDESHSESNPPTRKLWHGATLSSFTSIAMYPYPLISFALRTPAKMADLLRPLTMSTEINPNSDNNTAPKIHLAINLLAAHQSHLAIHFSRPRGLSTLTESNKASSSMSMQEPLSTNLNLQFTPTSEGIPILNDTLGALSCTLVTSIPLDMIHSESKPVHVNNPSSISRSNNIPNTTSELFIARVIRSDIQFEPEWGKFSLRSLPFLPSLPTMANITLGPVAAQCSNNASIASALAQACAPDLPQIPPLLPGNAYSGPADPDQSDQCICSSVTYSMVAACAYCQNGLFRNWAGDNSWSQNCTPRDLSVGSYPLTIPTNFSVPIWAYLNVSRTNTWDFNEAHQLSGSAPDITGQVTPTFSTQSPPVPTGLSVPAPEVPTFTPPPTASATKGNSNVGSIVGGVVGGIVGLLMCLIGVIILLRYRKRKKQEAAPVVSQFIPHQPATYRGVSQSYNPKQTFQRPRLYDPSDPSTFPVTPTPTPPVLSNRSFTERSRKSGTSSPSGQSSAQSQTGLISPLRTYPNVPNGRDWFTPVPEL